MKDTLYNKLVIDMEKEVTPLDVLRCCKDEKVYVGSIILPAWVFMTLQREPIPLLDWCVSLGYLGVRDHAKDVQSGHPTYNITEKGYKSLVSMS